MALRDIYLRIETISGYSPVEPDDHVSPPIQYRRDCMRNMGHEDGTIPHDEVAARRLTALIYRDYLDPQYLVPKPDKLVAADVNEPAFTRRVPGTVIEYKVRIFHQLALPVHAMDTKASAVATWTMLILLAAVTIIYG
jgi:hypothetical protein